MQNFPNSSQSFLTASELKAAWLAATELFLDIEMTDYNNILQLQEG
jgi:hypothetical protein